MSINRSKKLYLADKFNKEYPNRIITIKIFNFGFLLSLI